MLTKVVSLRLIIQALLLSHALILSEAKARQHRLRHDIILAAAALATVL